MPLAWVIPKRRATVLIFSAWSSARPIPLGRACYVPLNELGGKSGGGAFRDVKADAAGAVLEAEAQYQ